MDNWLLPDAARIRSDGTFADQPPANWTLTDGLDLMECCGVHCGTDSRGTRHCWGCHTVNRLDQAAVDLHERGTR